MSLSEEHLKFIEECKLEFSDRFTDAEPEYKKVYDEGIPLPPIMYPWYSRFRYNRDRAGGSRHREFGNRTRDWGGQNYNQNRHYGRYDRRDRPY